MKRTCPAKSRIITDTIKKNFQENSSMDLASRMIWRFGRPMKLDTSSFSVKSQSAVLHFCHLTSFAEETKENIFSVKSSWEVRWIIMFQKDAVCNKMSYSPCELQENKNPASEVISTHFDVFSPFYFLQKLPCSCQESMPQKLVKIP